MKITNKGCKNKHEINTDIFQKKKKTKKENMEGTDTRMSEEDKKKLKEYVGDHCNKRKMKL